MTRTRLRTSLTALRGLLAGLLLYAAMEAAVFGSGWYRRFLEPESLAGSVELLLLEESKIHAKPKPRIAVIGNSMLGEGFSAKIADRESAGRMSFSNLSIPASTPRCWCYILRDIDPEARRYAAIVVQTELYSDEDGDEPMADEIGDLRVAAGLLRPSDALDFAGSFERPRLRFEALRGALLKGYVFKYDLQALLEAPSKRFERLALFRPNHANWIYEYQGRKENLSGLSVDWTRGSLHVPGSVPAEIRARLQRVVLRKKSPQTGKQAAYRSLWLGRVLERYRSSGTLVVFIRVPRGPVVNPGSDPPDAPSVIRAWSSHPAVRVLPRSTFEPLERPEYFWDELHMNASGRELFSRQLARAIEPLCRKE